MSRRRTTIWKRSSAICGLLVSAPSTSSFFLLAIHFAHPNIPQRRKTICRMRKKLELSGTMGPCPPRLAAAGRGKTKEDRVQLGQPHR
ncbi:hypothetical protein PENSPDRAFT_111399 [Peniophora sp. CONT]|nr:hypothetical protein PENSPDRAFT_111399 [Peniophora sp. CONT]